MQHFQSLHAKRKVGYNYSDSNHLVQQVKADIKGMELCSAFTADHMTAARIEETFDDELQSRVEMTGVNM